MEHDRTAHLRGIVGLVDPSEKTRTKSAFETKSGREKWLRRLRHQIQMHPDYFTEPPKGSRDKDSLIRALEKLGAPETCYIIASDSDLDDSFHSLRYTLEAVYWEFNHGTIVSCIPGKLALFRTAYPHKNFIVRRP